jgi:integrase
MAKKRDDGRYRVSLDVGTGKDGKRVRKYFYGSTATEAKKKRAEYIKLHPQGSPLDHASDTLEKWCDYWYPLYNTGLATNTMKSRDIAKRQILEFDMQGTRFGSMPLASVKASHIRYYMNTLAGRDRSAISLHKSMLTRMFAAAYNDGIIATTPCAAIESPKARKREGHRLLEQWEQEVIVKAYPHHRAGLWAMIMMYAGLRKEEMAGLLWTDIDMEAKTLSVQRASELTSDGKTKEPKTKAGYRTVPLVLPLYNALNAVPTEQRRGNVCTNAQGKPLTLTSYKQAWDSFMLVCTRAHMDIKPYAATAGWRRDKVKDLKEFKCTAHDLRYTYATILYDAGVDVQTAANLLGHSDVTVTMKVYTQLSEKTKRQSTDKLLSFFDPHFDLHAEQK